MARYKVIIEDTRMDSVQVFYLDDVSYEWGRDGLTYIERLGEKVGIHLTLGQLKLNGVHRIPEEIFKEKDRTLPSDEVVDYKGMGGFIK